MANISDYLSELVTQKNNLITTLNEKGVSVNPSDTFNTLIPKVNDISGGVEKGIDKKLYSFGVLSDIHLKKTLPDNTNSVSCIRKALDFYKENNVDLVCIAGDILALNRDYAPVGSPHPPAYAQASEKIWLDEIMLNKAIYDEYPSINIKLTTGNHDVWAAGHLEHPQADGSYIGMNYKITTNETEYESYTDKTCYSIWQEQFGDINHVFERGDDVFIFMGMFQWNYVDFCRPSDITWLSEKLEFHKNKRVFFFCHVPAPNYFDGPSGSSGLVINQGVTNSRAYEFRTLINKYPNAIWFNGHTHYDLRLETDFENPNTFYEQGKMTQIHCSSLAYTRILGNPYINVNSGSQGYMVDVYQNKVVVNGIDFTMGAKGLPILDAQYIINN